MNNLSLIKKRITQVRIILGIFFLLLSLVSCKKETTVHGIVYDFYTHQPVQKGLEVDLLGDEEKFLIRETLTSTETNSVGEFNFNYSEKKAFQVRVEQYYSGYIYDNPDDSTVYADINSGKSNNVTLYVRQTGEYLITIHNTSPYDSNDYLQIHNIGDVDLNTNIDFSAASYHHFIGPNVDSSFYMNGAANTTNFIDYSVTKNSNTLEKRIYFDVFIDSTSTIEINY